MYKAVYSHVIENAIQECGGSLSASSIKASFCKIAYDARESNQSALDFHLGVLRMSKDFLSSLFSKTTCLVCISAPPERALDCGHGICSSCIRSIGKVRKPYCGEYIISVCPICQAANGPALVPRPPTATTRVLHLDAPLQQKYLTADFLKGLQSKLILGDMSLRDHFDFIHCSGVGSYFALSLCSQDRSVFDISRELQSVDRVEVRKPPLTRKRFIRFGGGQRWSLNDVRCINGPTIHIQHSTKTITNALRKPKESWYETWFQPLFSQNASYQRLTDRNSAEENMTAAKTLNIRYFGSIFDDTHLTNLANRLIGALFYVELTNPPRFYGGVETCTLQVLCRLPWGPAFTALYQRLRSARLVYSCDGHEQHSTNLFHTIGQEPTIQSVQSVQLEADSLDSIFYFEIEHDDARLPVGNCPYRLYDLISDQGLERPWQSSTDKPIDTATLACPSQITSMFNVEEELSGLYQILDTFIDSWY